MKEYLRSPGLLKKLARYSFVGICSNILGYGSYLLLVNNHLNPKVAVTLLYFIGIFVSYIGNKRLTFRDKEGFLPKSFRYAGIYLLGYLINLLLIFWFVDLLGFPHQIVQVVSIFLVAALLFIMLQAFVFGDHLSNG